MHHSRESSISMPKRHHKYYIEGGDLHILAGRTLFRVHGYFFSRESPIFSRKVNPTSPGDVKEGMTDHDPVILEGVPPEDFEKLLWVFYNPKYSLYDASVDDWQCILDLADRWGFKEVKELCVRELHKKRDLDLVHKMSLYQRYKVDPRHLVPLYAELCARDTPLTLAESQILGLESVVLINTTREKLRADPSNEGRSPLPSGLEEDDVFRAIEHDLGIELGASMKYRQETLASLSPSSSTNAQNDAQGFKFRGSPRKGGRSVTFAPNGNHR